MSRNPWRCHNCGAELPAPLTKCQCGWMVAVHRTRLNLTPPGGTHRAPRKRGPLHGLWRWLRDRL